jgi:hypothetical protein
MVFFLSFCFVSSVLSLFLVSYFPISIFTSIYIYRADKAGFAPYGISLTSKIYTKTLIELIFSINELVTESRQQFEERLITRSLGQ